MTEYITLKQAARHSKKSLQAMFQAIQRGSLRGKKMGKAWYTTKDWVDEYQSNKRDVTKVRVCGKPVYDKRMGTYSIAAAAKILGVSYNCLYHSVRIGDIKSTRVGSYYVLSSEDICKFQERAFENYA